MKMKLPSRKRGFGLIEMMVSIVPGIVVSGAAIAFVMSSLTSNTNFVRSARFAQDLRSNMDFVTRELRRAGYDENAMKYIALSATNNTTSPFATIKVVRPEADNSCVIYAYDSKAAGNGTTTGPGRLDVASGEVHAIRRLTRTIDGQLIGVMEVAQTSAAATSLDCDAAGPNYADYPSTCNDATGWCALSDPKQLDVTRFRIADSSIWIPPTAISNGSKVRDLELVMSGVLLGANQYVREMQSSVRVRAECLRPLAEVSPPDTTGTLCDAAPGA